MENMHLLVIFNERNSNRPVVERVIPTPPLTKEEVEKLEQLAAKKHRQIKLYTSLQDYYDVVEIITDLDDRQF